MHQKPSLFYNFEQTPLANRVRPRNLEEFVGQSHLISTGKVLRKLIESDKVTSMIFWGPPGVGKTTLAMIIAKMTKATFINFSAVTSGIKEIKEIMVKAEQNRSLGIKTLLFIDEIHRFNKAQQDAFLPHVEKGNITLIGATTENPSFEVNSALLSRCRVFVLKALTKEDITNLIKQTLDDKRAFNKKIVISEDLINNIASFSNGDARSALNILEMAVNSSSEKDNSIEITQEILKECMQKKILLYDKSGEEHYNIISALHKSMRNSDPDASVYWLARMLESGENPLYIARRLIRFASEDVGLADPRAIEIAVSCYKACHYIGVPECNVNLTQVVVYLAITPKSNALYKAYKQAKKDALNTLSESVPMHLRNAPTKLMTELGYGKDYQYAHELNEKVAKMNCLPESLKNKKYYHPTEQGLEKRFKERLNYINNIKKTK